MAARVAELRLIPSRGGVFEVQAGNRMIFSKKKEDRYPTAEEILASLAEI